MFVAYLILVSWIKILNSAPVTDNQITTTDLSCEAGWYVVEGECVAIVFAKAPTKFDKAMATCMAVNATLPIALTEAEWKKRLKQIDYSSSEWPGDSWLGLKCNPQTVTYRWMNGSNLSYVNFGVDPPPIDKDGTSCVTSCVYVSNTTDKWLVDDCAQQKSFVCIKPGFRPTTAATETSTRATTTSKPQPSITDQTLETTQPATSLPPCAGDDLKQLPSNERSSSCSLDPVNATGYEQAKITCRQQNRTLVFTKSRDDWITFQAMRTPYPAIDNMWIDIWYNRKSKRIEYSDGTPWRSAVNDWYPWSDGRQPNADTFGDTDRCVASTKNLDYLWNFENCNQSSYVGLCFDTIQPITTVTFSTSATEMQTSSTTISKPTTTTSTRITSLRPARLFVPKPMSPAERISSIVVQSMGCAFVIGGISLTLVLFVMFRNLSIEKIIIANEDLALLLAHCFVLTLREPALYPSMSPQLCKCVAVLLHYFFTCSYTFMFLEALQMMYIIGHVNRSGAILPTYVFLAIGWGAPLALVAVTGPIIGDEYSTYWTCWGDLERRFGWALFFPMVCICACTVIIVESAGMMNRMDPPNDADPAQLFSAKISQRGIVIVMSLTMASHILGIVAVYFQIVYLYVACFGINVSCAAAIVFFHTAVDSKIRDLVVRTWLKIRHCRRKKYTA